MKERAVSCGEVLYRSVYPERWRKGTRALVYGIDTMSTTQAVALLEVMAGCSNVVWRVPTRSPVYPAVLAEICQRRTVPVNITLEPLP